MIDILTLVTPFFLVIGCGYLAGRIGLVETTALKSLNSYLLYFALPGMFISRLSDIDLAQAFDVRLLVAFVAGNFVIWLISTVIQRSVFKNNLSETAAINTAAGWGNSGYMGIPLSVGLLGSIGLLHAFALLAADILVLSALAFVLHGLHSNGGHMDPLALIREVSKALFLNPFLLPFAIGGAISWYNLEPPTLLMDWAGMLGDSAFAVALFTIGAGMALRPLVINRQSMGAVIPSTLLKLLIHPLVSGIIAFALGLDAIAIAGIVVLTATPTATNAYILANRFNVKEAEAAAIIFCTTTLSAFTLPLALYLLRDSLPGIAGG